MTKQSLLMMALVFTTVLISPAWAGQEKPAADPAAKPAPGATGANSGAATRGATQSSVGKFGQPETMTGTVTLIVRKQGILVLTLAANTNPKTLSVETKQYESVQDGRTVHHKVTTTVTQSEDVDYSFRVTESTHIWIAGKRAGIADLQDLKNKAATIRFVPEPSGDIAEVVQIH